jgi:hypothetical protein
MINEQYVIGQNLPDKQRYCIQFLGYCGWCRRGPTNANVRSADIKHTQYRTLFSNFLLHAVKRRRIYDSILKQIQFPTWKQETGKRSFAGKRTLYYTHSPFTFHTRDTIANLQLLSSDD